MYYENFLRVFLSVELDSNEKTRLDTSARNFGLTLEKKINKKTKLFLALMSETDNFMKFSLGQ